MEWEVIRLDDDNIDHLDKEPDLKIYSHNLVECDDNNLDDLNSILEIFLDEDKKDLNDLNQNMKNQKKKS